MVACWKVAAISAIETQVHARCSGVDVRFSFSSITHLDAPVWGTALPALPVAVAIAVSAMVSEPEVDSSAFRVVAPGGRGSK